MVEVQGIKVPPVLYHMTSGVYAKRFSEGDYKVTKWRHDEIWTSREDSKIWPRGLDPQWGGHATLVIDTAKALPGYSHSAGGDHCFSFLPEGSYLIVKENDCKNEGDYKRRISSITDTILK